MVPRAPLALLVLAAPAFAGGYTDMVAWQAAAGAFQTEDFESIVSITAVPTLPSLGVDLALLSDGVSYPSVMATSSGAGGASTSGVNILANAAAPVLPGLGPIVLTPTDLGKRIVAVGYWNCGGDDSTELRFYDEVGGLIESQNTGTAGLVFNGIVNLVQPASRVEIDTGGLGNAWFTLDDLMVTLGEGFSGTPDQISVSTGGSQVLSLGVGAMHALKNYMVLGSVSGTIPGLPYGSQTIPLNYDPYLLFTLNNPNTPLLNGSAGILNSAGQATTVFTLPPGSDPGLVGLTVNHAAAVLELSGPTLTLPVVTAAASVLLVP